MGLDRLGFFFFFWSNRFLCSFEVVRETRKIGVSLEILNNNVELADEEHFHIT